MSETQYGSRSLYTPEKIFLLGDVHNEADKLMSVVDKITPQLGPNDHIVFCGDLVDRGAEAALTVEALIDLCRRFPEQVFFVEGNHDLMLRDYLSRGSTMWLQYLQPTLDDLALKWGLPDTMPATIASELINRGFKEITSRTIPYYETAEIIASHAPLDKTTVLMNGGMEYQEDYSEYIKDPTAQMPFRYLLDKMIHELKWQFTDENTQINCVDKFRVCGHQAGHSKSPRVFKDRAFIDTGCGLRPSGKLTCLVYPGKQWFQND